MTAGPDARETRGKGGLRRRIRHAGPVSGREEIEGVKGPCGQGVVVQEGMDEEDERDDGGDERPAGAEAAPARPAASGNERRSGSGAEPYRRRGGRQRRLGDGDMVEGIQRGAGV